MSDFITQHVSRMLREAENRIVDRVNGMLRNLTARLLLRTIITTASEGAGGRNALVDAVEGFLPGDGSQPASDDVERMELAGFLVVPVPKGPAVRLGDNSPVFSFPLAHPSYRPGGGKQGETCQYNLGDQQGTRWVRKNGRIEDTSSGGAKLTLDDLGRLLAEAAGGAKMEMDVSTLVTTLLRATHFGGNTAAPPPTALPGPALQGGGVVVLGTDASMRVRLVVNAPPPGIAGTLCIIAFGTAYDTPPQFSLAAAGDTALLIVAGVVPVGMGAVRAKTTQATLEIITDLPISPGTYELSVLVKQ